MASKVQIVSEKRLKNNYTNVIVIDLYRIIFLFINILGHSTYIYIWKKLLYAQTA